MLINITNSIIVVLSVHKPLVQYTQSEKEECVSNVVIPLSHKCTYTVSSGCFSTVDVKILKDRSRVFQASIPCASEHTLCKRAYPVLSKSRVGDKRVVIQISKYLIYLKMKRCSPDTLILSFFCFFFFSN